MSLFTATLAVGTLLANVRYRFYDAAGALAAPQSTGITQPIAGKATFVISCVVPAGAILMHIYDGTDLNNESEPLALNFARADELASLTTEVAKCLKIGQSVRWTNIGNSGTHDDIALSAIP